MRLAMPSAVPRLEPNSTVSGVPWRPAMGCSRAAGRATGAAASARGATTVVPVVRLGRGRSWMNRPSGLRVSASLIFSW